MKTEKKYEVPLRLIYGSDPTKKELEIIAKVKEALEKTEVFKSNQEVAEVYLTEAIYHRFLKSRKYDFDKSLARLESHLEWRFVKRKPHLLRAKDVKMFNVNGCMQVSPRGPDRFGRPIILMDRKKMKNIQTGSDKYDEDLTLISHTLELATKHFTAETRRYVVFMDMSAFSVFGNPPRHVQKSIIDMLGAQFPETLGLGIIYGAPYVFHKFFDMIKVFIEEGTRKKVLFLPTKVSKGSDIDLKLKAYIGNNWRSLLGIDLKPVTKSGARGYDHENYWAHVEAFEQKFDTDC